MNNFFLAKNYNQDALCIDISNFTTTPLSYVYEKPFIGYLHTYLQKWANIEPTKENGYFCGITMLIENEYIDYSYIDDFSNFYSKSYSDYKKKCMRIHFFEAQQKEVESLYNFTESVENKLKNHYLGFIVLRPIPEYYIARACLKKWNKTDKNHLLLSRTVKASILGVTFELDTIPFMEQDHETSVCATSALWTFFLANNYYKTSVGVSPFSITNIALTKNQVCNDDILAPGFTVEMICSCIREKGLSPLVLDVDQKDNKNILDLIHIFLKSDYPVILGLQVYSKKEDIVDINKSFGAHAVTVVGDQLSKSEVYIHDDRIGFFARLKLENNYWKLEYTNSASKVIQKPEDEFYVITDFVTGIYKKIRLPVSYIQKFCEKLKDDLCKYVSKRNSNYESYILNVEFEPYIVDSSQYKEKVRGEYKSYKNNIDDFFYMPLPKFCWIVQINYDGQECASFLFDATDMEYGNCLLYILFKSNAWHEVITKLYEAYKKEFIKGISRTNIFTKQLSPLYNYFDLKEKNKNTIYQKLDNLFGIAKGPLYLKSEEFIADEIKNQEPHCFTCLSDVKDFIFSEKVPYYLWIIDEEGYLYIGLEDNDDKDSLCKGHPTLINGRKGRIGGEIWSETNGSEIHWYINHQSGRYSWIDTDKSLLKKFMDNVINERINVYFKQYNFSYKEKRPRK